MKEISTWKSLLWLMMLTSSVTGNLTAQQANALSVQQAVDFAMKNSALVKNALIGIQIQRETNREITAAAYPQLNGSITGSYFPKVPVQSFPNFIAAATYGVLENENVKDGGCINKH